MFLLNCASHAYQPSSESGARHHLPGVMNGQYLGIAEGVFTRCFLVVFGVLDDAEKIGN